jgi:hypothetical protein
MGVPGCPPPAERHGRIRHARVAKPEHSRMVKRDRYAMATEALPEENLP